MKTISDDDWPVIQGAVKKVIDTTLSRGEKKTLEDAMARVEAVDDRADEKFGSVSIQDIMAVALDSFK